MFTKSNGYALGTGLGVTEKAWIYEVKGEGSEDDVVEVLEPLANGSGHKFEVERGHLVEITKYEFDTIYDMVADGVPNAHAALTEYLIKRGGPVNTDEEEAM